jgi:hypothetical protein
MTLRQWGHDWIANSQIVRFALQSPLRIGAQLGRQASRGIRSTISIARVQWYVGGL